MSTEGGKKIRHSDKSARQSAPPPTNELALPLNVINAPPLQPSCGEKKSPEAERGQQSQSRTVDARPGWHCLADHYASDSSDPESQGIQKSAFHFVGHVLYFLDRDEC